MVNRLNRWKRVGIRRGEVVGTVTRLKPTMSNFVYIVNGSLAELLIIVKQNIAAGTVSYSSG